MMNANTRLAEFLSGLQRIHLASGSPEVCSTIADELVEESARSATITAGGRTPTRAATLTISVGRSPRSWRGKALRPPARWVFFGVDDRGRGHLRASAACHLYAFFRHLVEDCREQSVAGLSRRPLRTPAFAWQRPIWDLYFNQAARSVRGMDRAEYARQMARLGFTHLEVNGLASPEGHEEGVPGEVYPRFYTYLPALDQFVASFLNRGCYPKRYLKRNLERLKADSRLAARYGLIPSITCFEPRSVPERLLAKYPELRGARVDHPFRSFKPRFNLAVSHPVVRRHYRELIQNLLREVPELGCMSVWSNDSGAGFEFTRSLYVGANGSAYLVREWSDEDVFTRGAARNVVEFLRMLQSSGAEINPGFRVATRLEPFVPEREAVMGGLGDGVDVEVASLFDRGWESPYGHPLYEDCSVGPFTIYNNRFAAREKSEIRRLKKTDCRTHVMYAHGPVNNFEPLLAVPAPWLTFEKLRDMHAAGAEYLAHTGGLAPPSAVRWNLNQEVFRRFQFDPRIDIDETVTEIARGWAGERLARDLVRAWRHAERAIRAYHPNPLYISWCAWYRILTRPLVPDIEAIPESKRRYYEEQILSTHHNPNRFDLRRDVLFDLMTPPVAGRAVTRIDRSARPPLERAIGVLAAALERSDAGDEHAADLLTDQLDRLRALRCWFVTNRNVSAWIANVYGFLESKDQRRRRASRKRLREMVRLEIDNTRDLLQLWEGSKTVFMAVAEEGQTTFIHGTSFGADLRRKIALMTEYGDLTPRIDPDVMWRVAELG